MRSCVFPGSFDPVTKGHLDLISRAAAIFDRVTVAVMVNIRKTGAIPVPDRIRMLQKVCAPYVNVRIESWDGLLAEYMKKKKETVIVRGIRNTRELEQELDSAAVNRMLNGRIETVFLPSDPGLTAVSSSAVREIAAFGGDIQAFVPDDLTEEIYGFLSKK